MSSSRSPRPSSPLTRRQLLARAGVVVGAAAAGFGIDRALVGGGPGDAGSGTGAASSSADASATAGPLSSARSARLSGDGDVRSFVSQPSWRVPVISGTGSAGSPGLIFLGPGTQTGLDNGVKPPAAQMGAMIVDRTGEPVWFAPQSTTGWTSNVRVQSYQGKPVLTYWEGVVIEPGFGVGEGVILDTSYREVARVKAGGGRHADLHEFALTDQGTALITCYPERTTADLSAIGGPTDGVAIGSIVQEIDIASGRLLLEWRSLQHVPISDSYEPYDEPYDYMHVNTVGLLPDGNLLISARATWALYKLDRTSGAVMWQLGGKHSDFSIGPGAHFAWQHDGHQVSPGAIAVFDNGDGARRAQKQSRGLLLDVDETAMTVSLRQAYAHPAPLLASSMGSVQPLPDGHVYVGWGYAGHASEFTAGGELVDDLALRPGHFSYRDFRSPWQATPHQPPALVADPGASGSGSGTGSGTTLYASWNGATEVTGWRVETGARGNLRAVGTVAAHGFETEIRTGLSDGYVAVTALDGAGRALATSATVRV